MSSRPNQADSIITGDQVIIYRGNSTSYLALPFDTLKSTILDGITTGSSSSPLPVVQRYNPTANFTLIVENHAAGTYLLLNPASGIDSGTLTLPINVEVVDQQQIMFSCSQQITNLTINGNGAAVIGAPNAIAATAFFKLQYDQLSGTWYRVG